MSQAYTLPGTRAGRPAAARPPLSKPELSRLILTGTAAVIFGVLLLWLIVSRLFTAPARSYQILVGTFGAPADAAVVAFLAEDLRPIGRPTGRDASPKIRPAEFKQAATRLLERSGGRPVIFYLTGVGLVVSGDTPEARAAFAPDGASGSSKEKMLSAAEVLEPLLTSRSVPKLLILDVGQVGGDRNLGAFGGGFLDQLKTMVAENRNLVVMTSCAPGQMSWTSEPERTSVFGYYVAEGLAGAATDWTGQVTVSALHRYVSSNVAQWVERNRAGAVQTPLLLGAAKSDFAMRPLPDLARLADPDRAEKEPKLLERLEGAWKQRDQLAPSRPYRHAPSPWRLFREDLLRAERAFRAGRWAEAEEAIRASEDHRQEVARLADGPATQSRSLAMLARSKAGDSEATKAQIVAYEKAIQEAIAAPAEPTAPAPAGEAPAKPKADAAASAAKGAAPAAKGDAAPLKPKPGAAPAGAKEGGGDGAGAPAVAAPPVAALTADVAHTLPTFVEGQLPVWYDAFAKAGGESDALRAGRRDLLLRAAEVRDLAEQAAALDPRVLHRVRTLVEDGDALRRKAQDALFAGESSSFRGCRDRLDEAEKPYRRAIGVADHGGRALDLLQRLRDELPYYGDWQARRGEGLGSTIENLLAEGADLADLLDDDRAGGESPDEWAQKLDQKATDIERRLTQLDSELKAAARQAGREGSSAGWVEIDALLRAPMIPAAERVALLRRVGSPDLSPPLADQSGDSADSSDKADDPAAMKRDLALARVEAGLLRLAGFPVEKAEESLKRASTSRADDPARAREALDAFSATVRDLRAGALRREPVDPLGEEEGAVRKSRAVADAAARALPPADLETMKLAGDPAELRDAFDLHAMLVWHARRLDEDFAARHAEFLLDDARRLLSSRASEQTAARVRRRRDAGLMIGNVAADKALDRNGRLTVEVRGEGALPEGLAAILLPRTTLADPQAGAGTNVGSLLPVPVPTGGARQTLLVERGADREVAPVIFYRGRVFATGDKVRVAALPDLVSVEIRQQSNVFVGPSGRKEKVLDQFVASQQLGMRRGFLHPRNNLAYKLVIRNRTREPLDVWIKHELPGRLAVPERRRIEAGGQIDDVFGIIQPGDVEFDKPKLMTVEVRQDDENGQRLCAPMEVEFKKLHPKDFITAVPALGNAFNDDAQQRLPIFGVIVTHEGEADPVHVPADVVVRPTPANAFREIRRGEASQLVPHGDKRIFRFWVLKPDLETIKWSVDAEGVTNVIAEEFHLNEKPAPPAAPPAGAAPPPGAPPPAPPG